MLDQLKELDCVFKLMLVVKTLLVNDCYITVFCLCRLCIFLMEMITLELFLQAGKKDRTQTVERIM